MKVIHFFLGLVFGCFSLAYLAVAKLSGGSEISSTKKVIKNVGKDSSLTKVDRGKIVSAQVTEEELYNAYLSIRNEYNEKAFLCDGSNKQKGKQCGSWKTLKSKDGIEVSMLQHPSDPSCPYVRMVATMPGKLEDVWNFLSLDNWERTMPKMDPFYEGVEITKRYAFDPSKKKKRNKKNMNGRSSQSNLVEMTLARKKTKRLLTFGKRDFTFVQVSDVPQDDGVLISGTVSVITDKLPRQKGYTRAFQDSVAFYEQINTADEPVTKITIMCRIDLNDSSEGGDGGSVPMWIYVKTIGSSGVLTIQNMRREIQNEFKERQTKKGNIDDETQITSSNSSYTTVSEDRSWFSRWRRGLIKRNDALTSLDLPEKKTQNWIEGRSI